METKKCKTCNCDKNIEEFPYHNKKLGTRMAHCNECYKAKRKQWRLDKIDQYRETNKKSYKNNKKSRIEKSKEYQKKNPEKRKEWTKKNRNKTQLKWVEWKSTLSCTKCGENHPSCLEFHHINPNEKEGLITKLRFSKKRLEAELLKCVVLCCNCHRKHHFNENNKNNCNLSETNNV